MGNWSLTKKIDPIQFDGDSVELVLGRLEVADMITLSAYIKTGEDGVKQNLSFSDSMEMCRVAGELLPKYVKSVKGMSGADGIDMSLDQFNQTVPSQFYFMTLIGEILGALVVISTVSEGDEKNSGAPLEGNSMALVQEGQLR